MRRKRRRRRRGGEEEKKTRVGGGGEKKKKTRGGRERRRRNEEEEEEEEEERRRGGEEEKKTRGGGGGGAAGCLAMTREKKKKADGGGGGEKKTKTKTRGGGGGGGGGGEKRRRRNEEEGRKGEDKMSSRRRREEEEDERRRKREEEEEDERRRRRREEEEDERRRRWSAAREEEVGSSTMGRSTTTWQVDDGRRDASSARGGGGVWHLGDGQVDDVVTARQRAVVLGGISTSLLFTAFESWLVSEHIRQGFDANWMSVSFSKAIFLGNGVVAICSGLLANTLVVDAGLGPVAPFDAAVCVLVIGMMIIAFTWTENYGDSSEGKNLILQFATAAKLIAADEKIALLGAIQSLFESSMYTFIFLWTPALASETKFGFEIPHGFVFATFMLASMIGSSVASRLLARPFLRVERYMQFVFLVASASLLLPAYAGYFDEHRNNVAAAEGISPGGRIQMAGFLIFEVCVGIFWPSMMKMRSDYVPEESRSTIMNFFRIPLNMFVCIVLFNVSVFPIGSMFAMCAALLVAAALLTRRLLILSTTEKACSTIDQWRAEAKHQYAIATDSTI
ncbi:hypothetical protein CBR_g23298 [Chara braunii]|uniref:Molybdate-anion transporter n=1 Tax=Chara braunii TaxID=69332 RepID=A0A388L401_CHABU|nr:hypothetical protein CBR_g23298 [Chara braunii]|eukprot:GBG76968.1 hypothetical protein CBR_g23298 [Chara braunii]